MTTEHQDAGEQKVFMGGSGLAAAPEPYGPLVLSYDTEGVAWSEALPVGNGRLGAMVFGGTSREHIQLNEDTLWSGGPHQPANPAAKQHLEDIRKLVFNGKYHAATELAASSFMGTPASQAAYQAFGDLFIDRGDALERPFSEYRRQLDLDTGVTSVWYECSGVKHTRRVVARRDVIAVHMTSGKPEGYIISTTSPHPNSSVRIEGGNTIVLSGHNGQANGITGALRFEGLFQIRTNGHLIDGKDHIRVKGSTEVTILIAMATSFKRFDDVSGDPRAATRHHLAQTPGSFEEILRDTVGEHQRIFRRVSVSLGETPLDIACKPIDERLEAFRDGGTDPALWHCTFNTDATFSLRPRDQGVSLQIYRVSGTISCIRPGTRNTPST